MIRIKHCLAPDQGLYTLYDTLNRRTQGHENWVGGTEINYDITKCKQKYIICDAFTYHFRHVLRKVELLLIAFSKSFDIYHPRQCSPLGQI